MSNYILEFLSTTKPYCDFVQCLNPLSQPFTVPPGQLYLLLTDSAKRRASKRQWLHWVRISHAAAPCCLRRQGQDQEDPLTWFCFAISSNRKVSIFRYLFWESILPNCTKDSFCELELDLVWWVLCTLYLLSNKKKNRCFLTFACDQLVIV